MRVLATTFAAAFLAAPALAAPAFAAPSGPPVDRFASTWTSPPSGAFAPGLPAKVVEIKVRQADVPADVVLESVMSAGDDSVRRNVAIDEMESPLPPAQRTALEDLRDAQRRWVAVADGDPAARDTFFAVALRDVVEGTGRSVARDGDNSAEGAGDGALDTAFASALRGAPDDEATALQESQQAWAAYRDAFARFANTMDRPDAATAVKATLARRRTDELRAAETR